MKIPSRPVLTAALEELPAEELLAALLRPGAAPLERCALGRRLLVASGGLPRLARMSTRELLREFSDVLAPVRGAADASPLPATAGHVPESTCESAHEDRGGPESGESGDGRTGAGDGESPGDGERPRIGLRAVRRGEPERGGASRAARRGAEHAALRLASAFELGRRAARVELAAGQAVRGMADIEPHLRGLLDGRLKEQFLVVLLDAKNRPLRTERVSEGCLTWSVVHPREVYAPAVRESAGAVIVAHNHPSGDPTPSAQDIEVTARLAKVGELLGIPLLDHIVVGRQRCVSMRAQGLMGSLAVPA